MAQRPQNRGAWDEVVGNVGVHPAEGKGQSQSMWTGQEEKTAVAQEALESHGTAGPYSQGAHRE